MIKLFKCRFLPFMFLLSLALTACVPSNYLSPTVDPYDLARIPYQSTYKTANFLFQSPLSGGWKQYSFIEEDKITIFNHQARAWISVSYLELSAGQRFDNQKDLIEAFVQGEEAYLKGNLTAPITRTHIHEGFTQITWAVPPKTIKMGVTYFKALRYYSINTDDQKKRRLNLYLTPAKDLSGIFVVAMVSPEVPPATSADLKTDMGIVLSSFEALR